MPTPGAPWHEPHTNNDKHTCSSTGGINPACLDLQPEICIVGCDWGKDHHYAVAAGLLVSCQLYDPARIPSVTDRNEHGAIRSEPAPDGGSKD